MKNFVLFSAKWCNPCNNLKQFLATLAESHDFDLTIVDIEENPELAAKHRVRGVPTMLKMSEGKVQGFITGTKTSAEVQDFMEL